MDEYQDVAESEYRLIQLISGLRRSEDDTRSVQVNLCVIGDDDQNIYEFRGTSLLYILQFQAEYSAERFLLTENYRSTESIIAAASALIQNNPQRCKGTPEEQVRIDQERRGLQSDSVRTLQFIDETAQAGWICKQVQSWLQAGVPSREIAILARYWDLLSPVRALLERAGISTYALRDESISLTRNWVASQLIDTLRTDCNRLLSPAESVHQWFQQLFHQWRRDNRELTLQTLLKIAVDLDQERNYGSAELAQPISFNEILTAIFEFAQSGEVYLQENSVLVTSCHGAKGLEFSKVILLTDRFSLQRNEIEAERRLFYVAMTRAKEELVLCSTQPSRFVQETGISVEGMDDRSQDLPQFMLYLDLTPKDVKLGHPATTENQSVITHLREGDPLLLMATQNNDGWTIRTQRRQIIGALSKDAVQTLQRQRICPGQFQFCPGEVSVRYIYHHLKLNEVTGETLEDWFVVIPQIRVCR